MAQLEFAVEVIFGVCCLFDGNSKMIIQPANDSPDLTALERSVLETACSATGTDTRFYQQIDAAAVAVRTPSGVGFMTKLHVPAQYDVTDGAIGIAVPGSIPVIIGEHPALPSGAEFVLQIKDGRINCIEAFCYEGQWPADESLFNLRVGS